jgi:hypothetical protein
MIAPGPTIRVKFLAKALPGRDYSGWLRRFPGKNPRWGSCHFIFDQKEPDYDWLVVYDDLPARAGERFPCWEERLPDSCPKSQTLLITTEPSTIKIYGRAFTRQFGWILTSQEPWAIRHPGAIHSQPGLVPFYGGSGDRGSHDTLAQSLPAAKTSVISTVCSAKQQGHTLHHARFLFVQKLQAAMPELDVFGFGVRPVEDKADALDPYRYHVAIENHVFTHHWTEKLSDSFLGRCLTFYHGCPNYADYFPAESVIPINIHNFPEALATIRRAILDNEYERRLPAILESRRRVLEEHWLFALLARLIESRASTAVQAPDGGSILSRRALRRRRPFMALGLVLEKPYARLRHKLQRNA